VLCCPAEAVWCFQIIDGNDLAEIPRELCNLRTLTHLDISSNVIRRLPNTLGNMT